VLIELDAIMQVFSAMLDHNNFGLGPIDLSLISMEALFLINEVQCPYNQNTITGQYETGMQCNHSAACNDDPAVTGSILKDMAANSSPDKKGPGMAENSCSEVRDPLRTDRKGGFCGELSQMWWEADTMWSHNLAMSLTMWFFFFKRSIHCNWSDRCRTRDPSRIAGCSL
jgi:hypothetical protein